MKLPSEGHIVVSPKMAQDWLSEFNYEHQRKIRAYHVATLRDEILAGRFRAKTQITFCRLQGRDGKHILTNGQHTLSAIVAANESVLLDVIVTEVKSLNEVADDYARHDTHLTRQLVDSLVAHDLPSKFGITATRLNHITAAAIFLATMKGEIPKKAANQISHDKKLNIVEKYAVLGRDALNVIEGDTNKPYLNRKTSLACIMAIYEKEPGYCAEFFGEMVKDDGLRQGDPRKALLDFLRDSTTGGGNTRTLTKRKVHSDHELVKSIAVCWNAYIDRRDVKVIRVNFSDRIAVFKMVGTFTV